MYGFSSSIAHSLLKMQLAYILILLYCRVLFNNTIALGWDTYLAWKADASKQKSTNTLVRSKSTDTLVRSKPPDTLVRSLETTVASLPVWGDTPTNQTSMFVALSPQHGLRHWCTQRSLPKCVHIGLFFGSTPIMTIYLYIHVQCIHSIRSLSQELLYRVHTLLLPDIMIFVASCVTLDWSDSLF